MGSGDASGVRIFVSRSGREGSRTSSGYFAPLWYCKRRLEVEAPFTTVNSGMVSLSLFLMESSIPDKLNFVPLTSTTRIPGRMPAL
jgi:hypothetical protein